MNAPHFPAHALPAPLASGLRSGRFTLSYCGALTVILDSARRLVAIVD